MNNRAAFSYPAEENTILSEQTITRRIGRTTYNVAVHFSQTSRETINDKILRLIKNDVQDKAVGE